MFWQILSPPVTLGEICEGPVTCRGLVVRFIGRQDVSPRLPVDSSSADPPCTDVNFSAGQTAAERPDFALESTKDAAASLSLRDF